jgi:hypothetical protein
MMSTISLTHFPVPAALLLLDTCKSDTWIVEAVEPLLGLWALIVLVFAATILRRDDNHDDYEQS